MAAASADTVRRFAHLLFVACLVTVTAAGPAEPRADTGLGALRGKIEHSRSNSKPVYTFLGVPYAQVPARFAAPEPIVAYWTEARDAVEFKPHCMHDIRLGKHRLSKLGLSYPHERMSEDCLYLNVYSPSLPTAPPSGAAQPDPLEEILYGVPPYPVIVYLHGGNFVMWSGSIFSPVELVAEQRVVVVTLNYRLGPFGFMCVGKAANVGLLDQIEALKWVQNNIRAFHGDPNRVTLMGFSAGAASVGLHLLSPLSRGLFRRVILQSGSGLSVKAVTSHPEAAVRKLTTAVNCSDTSSPTALLSCLRGMDAAVLADHRPGSMHDTWRPCVDGRVLPAHPQALYRERQLNPVAQLMIGFTELEAFAWLNDETDGDYDESDFDETVRSYLSGSRVFSESAARRLVPEVRSAYVSGGRSSSSSDDDYDSPENSDGAMRRATAGNVYRASAADAISDFLVTAPAIKTAELHALLGTDVYVYQFAYPASYHGHATGRPSYVLATHGDDAVPALGLVFDASFRLGPVDDSDRKMSRRFMSAVGCFARSGNPNSPTLQGHIWPRFFAESRWHVLAADATSWHPHGMLKAELQPFWDSYLFGVINGAPSVPDDRVPEASPDDSAAVHSMPSQRQRSSDAAGSVDDGGTLPAADESATTGQQEQVSVTAAPSGGTADLLSPAHASDPAATSASISPEPSDAPESVTASADSADRRAFDRDQSSVDGIEELSPSAESASHAATEGQQTKRDEL